MQVALFAIWAAVAGAARHFQDQHHLRAQKLNIVENAKVHARELTRRIQVRKPITDKRDYVQATFDSGLKVLAVQDPEAVKSAFAVAVEAGSFEDPPDFPGLAHFCEHMLFLGSKKHPNPEDFSEALSSYGGQHNAYTAAEETVYYNEMGVDGLEKGLDIFAQFFIAPAFASSMVDKEIHAVDSEHKKNMPDVKHRLWHLLRMLANPKSPLHKFSTGNLETLKETPEKEGKSLPDALKAFHSKNYCSKRLHLVLINNMTADKQLELAHKFFDEVPKSTAETCPPRPVYTDIPAYSKDLGNLGRKITIPTHGTPEMWVMFPTLPLKKKYKTLAESYIWNAMGHFGPGSLKEKLKAEDLSHTYTYYADSTVAGTNILFTFHLTENGSKNYEKILDHVFAFFNKIRKQGINEKLVSSMADLRQVEFDYQEKKPSEFDFVSKIAGATPSYSPEDVLTGGFIMDKKDPKLMVEVLNSIVPENMNVLLVDPTFKQSDGSHHEKYYDFSYRDEPLEPELVARLGKSFDDKLTPPPPLKYVPTKMALINETAGEEPRKLLNQGRVDLWWHGMGVVKLPKVDINIKLGYSSEIVSRVDGNIIAAMHSRLVQSLLEAPTDEMQMCGMQYSLSAASDGLSLSFRGFDQHIEALVAAVLPTVRDPKFTTQQFDMVRRQLLLDLEDITTLQPYQHAMEAFEIVTVNGHFSRAELIAMAKSTSKVNPEAYKKFLGEVFEQAQMTLLFVGNIDAVRAEKMTQSIEAQLGVSRKDKALSHIGTTQVLNPKEEIEVRVRNPLLDDPNHATLATYQFGVPTIKERVHMALIGDIIERPVFETLRTEHQLGYVVAGYVALHVSTAEVRVLVQGFREDPDAVDLLIENTLANLTKHIADMDATEFAKRKKSVYTTLAQEDKTIKQEANRLWSPIWNQDYCFQKHKFLLKYLESPLLNSTAPLLDMWNKMVKPSKNRKKIVVKLFGETKLASNQTNSTGSVVFKMDINRPGVKVVTLVNSVDVATEMKDEKYWPRDIVCKDPLK